MRKALACLGDVNALVVSISFYEVCWLISQASHAAMATQASDSLTAMLGLAQSKVNNEAINRKRIESERMEKRLEKEVKSGMSLWDRVEN